MIGALIPPIGYEHMALRGRIHLVLPIPELRGSVTYIDVYRTARKRGDYIILDNGCAEGELVTSAILMHFAQRIGAHEIVAPDVMNESHDTLEATKKFLVDFPDASDYNIMAVVQGREMYERQYLVDEFAKEDAITTLGIPKAHVLRQGSSMRLRLVEWVTSNFPGRFKIHLLGLSKEYPAELRDVKFPAGVRSYDSALPFKAAEFGVRLDGIHIPHCTRREGYFTRIRQVPPPLLDQNIQTFLSWGSNEG